jgi:hypothetical protein
MSAVTYAEVKAFHAPILDDLERIAHRIRQGAIADDHAATKLRAIADLLEAGPRKDTP